VAGLGSKEAGRRVAMAGAGNITIGLFEQSAVKPIADPDASLEITHVAFLVDGDKFSDVLATIRGQEIAITESPEDTEITFSFFIKDLDGKSF